MFRTKSDRRCTPNSTKTKLESVFNITYTNVSGLGTKFPVVELYVHGVKPGLSLSILVQELTTQGFSSIIIKQFTHNRHCHLIGAYI